MMRTDKTTREKTGNRRLGGELVELSLEELDAEPMVALPGRAQMRMHRCFFSTRHRGIDNRFRFNRSGFSPFGFNHVNRFGNAINVNRTFQSNFNPQFSFGGGSIMSHNVNMNTNFQFAL